MKLDFINETGSGPDVISEMIFNNLKAEFKDTPDEAILGLARSLQNLGGTSSADRVVYPHCQLIADMLDGLQLIRGL